MWSVASEPNLAGLLGVCQSPGSCDFPNISPKTGDLRSVRITGSHHYYIPIRHLPSQAPSLTGSLLSWLPIAITLGQISLVAHLISLYVLPPLPRCNRSGAYHALLPEQQRSSSLLWRVDLHNSISRPAQCSLTLRPVESVDPLTGPFQRVLQSIRLLLNRSLYFRLERELAGSDLNRRIKCTLARHTQ